MVPIQQQIICTCIALHVYMVPIQQQINKNYAPKCKQTWFKLERGGITNMWPKKAQTYMLMYVGGFTKYTKNIYNKKSFLCPSIPSPTHPHQPNYLFQSNMVSGWCSTGAVMSFNSNSRRFLVSSIVYHAFRYEVMSLAVR